MEQRRRKPTELQKISDPNFLVEVAVGPPLADLVPQRPGTGIVVWGQYCGRETRYIWKKAYLSEDDNRIFDVEGRLMAVSHHYEKNPYESLDPLNVLPSNPLGDWESICYISGYHGMPDLKVRPKGLMQVLEDCHLQSVFFPVKSISCLIPCRREFVRDNLKQLE